MSEISLADVLEFLLRWAPLLSLAISIVSIIVSAQAKKLAMSVENRAIAESHVHFHGVASSNMEELAKLVKERASQP